MFYRIVKIITRFFTFNFLVVVLDKCSFIAAISDTVHCPSISDLMTTIRLKIFVADKHKDIFIIFDPYRY